MKIYLEELNCFLKNKVYMFSMFLTAVLSYGYAAVNTTVSIDDTRGAMYVGSGNAMLSAGRFGMTLFSKIFGHGEKYIYNSFTIDVISVILFIWAAINFCILFRRIASREIGMFSCTVFSCILISYPLMNEIWEYTGAGLCICMEFFCVSGALLLIWRQIHGKWRVGGVISSLFLLMLVCASYESLTCVYIFLVFAVLTLQVMYGQEKEKKVQEIFRQGALYAGALAGGLLLKIIVHRMILLFFHLSKSSNGAVVIAWGQVGLAEGIAGLLKSLWKTYVIEGIIYMPLTEFLLCMFLLFGLGTFLLIQYKNMGLLITFAGMFLSPFLLAFLQGTSTPNRACQAFAVFVAFTLLLLLTVLGQSKKKVMRMVYALAVGGCLFLSLHQAIYLNYFLTLNHFRWEEEQRVICSVGEELTRTQDMNKPVVFTGYYNLSDEITEMASISKDSFRWKLYAYEYARFHGEDFQEVFEYYGRKIPGTNVQSVLGWASYTRGAYQDLFGFCGFTFIEPDSDMNLDALDYVNTNEVPRYPNPGYMQDRGSYILVNF